MKRTRHRRGLAVAGSSNLLCGGGSAPPSHHQLHRAPHSLVRSAVTTTCPPCSPCLPRRRGPGEAQPGWTPGCPAPAPFPTHRHVRTVTRQALASRRGIGNSSSRELSPAFGYQDDPRQRDRAEKFLPSPDPGRLPRWAGALEEIGLGAGDPLRHFFFFFFRKKEARMRTAEPLLQAPAGGGCPPGRLPGRSCSGGTHLRRPAQYSWEFVHRTATKLPLRHRGASPAPARRSARKERAPLHPGLQRLRQEFPGPWGVLRARTEA